jgi:hypothetical protein
MILRGQKYKKRANFPELNKKDAHKSAPVAQLSNNPLKHDHYFCSFSGSTHLYAS